MSMTIAVSVCEEMEEEMEYLRTDIEVADFERELERWEKSRLFGIACSDASSTDGLSEESM